jgi:NAD+ synthase (glutamine-hydrolysing)
MELGVKPESMISPVKACGLNLGCVICEDAWDRDYAFSPLQVMTGQPLDLVVNCSSSPFTVNKNLKRHRVLSEKCLKLRVPLIYVNNVGIQNNGKTIYTFDGSSGFYDCAGNALQTGRRFQEDLLIYDLPLDNSPFGKTVDRGGDDISAVHEALIFGLRAFLRQCGIRRVVVGLSGGIDSATVACLCSQIISRKDLLLVNMPGRFNSPTTINLARATAKNLGCYYAEVPIDRSVKLTISQIDRLEIKSCDKSLRERLRLSDSMLENVQARDRSARILSAMTAAFGGAFTCNANKAETTVGYSTFYGDLAGFIAPLGDLWKGEVYKLARFMNENIFKREVVPRGCFTLTPSAELSPAQNVDEKKGDPLIYPYHDRLFASWVERWQRITPEEILEWRKAGRLESEIGYDGKLADIFRTNRAFIADLERWWKMYCGLGVAKRIQAPPILAVTRRAFGFDHREAQTSVWFSKRYLELKKQLLARG